MSRSYIPLPPSASMACSGTALPKRVIDKKNMIYSICLMKLIEPVRNGELVIFLIKFHGVSIIWPIYASAAR
jgi:hypothetical protein